MCDGGYPPSYVEQLQDDYTAVVAERDAHDAQLRAVLDVCDEAEYAAVRWEEPLPLPAWVAKIRAAAGVPAYGEYPIKRFECCDHKHGSHPKYSDRCSCCNYPPVGEDTPTKADDHE